MNMKSPAYLSTYADLCAQNPRQAAIEWFKNAKYGLFITYGLYSLLGKDEWVMFNDRIPISEYAKLKDRFTAEHFNAEEITDFAVKCGMKYITLVTCHHDMFCLWDTKQTDFNSVNSPARKDFVAEFAKACEVRGLGLVLYYSYGLSWKHPYSLDNKSTGISFAKPHYDFEEPSFKYRKPEDFKRYISFVHKQITELLSNYGPIAGMWFDLISPVYTHPSFYNMEETYTLVRRLQPHCLISYKQGANGDEDYMSQEMEFVPLSKHLRNRRESEAAVALSEKIWNMNKNKWNEVCQIMQKDGGWGYVKDAAHKSPEEVMSLLVKAHGKNCNLLLNIGPMPDGSIHPEDFHTLLAVGRILKENGFPTSEYGSSAEAITLTETTETGAQAI